MKVAKISRSKFFSLVMFVREPSVFHFVKELEYYSNSDSTILGVIIFDFTDKDYNVTLLCRDESGIFRAFKTQIDFKKFEEAEEWLIQNILWHTSQGLVMFPQYDKRQGLDLFQDVIPKEKQHPIFIDIKNSNHSYPTKQILNEISKFYKDIDGNFIEQFQSKNGFEARLWEIFLFCLFTEELFKIKRESFAPDYIVEKMGIEIAVEAVIVGRLKSNPIDLKVDPNELLKKTENVKYKTNDVPLLFGSSLYSKLSKEYWKLPNVNGKPILFALADFHDDLSWTWSFNQLIEYLYGYQYNFYYSKSEELIITSKRLDKYKKKSGAEIESGFFNQPNAENISAILSTPNATISKFTRIGIQAGYKLEGQKVYRVGFCHNHDPNASRPNEFYYEVKEGGEETWTESVNMYHNPNAKYPIDRDFFPNIAHHYFIDNNIVSYIPEFHSYSSITLNTITK